MISLPSWTRFWWTVPLALLALRCLSLSADLRTARSDVLAERNAHSASGANWRAATATARLLDMQNKQLTEELQAAETRRISDDYEARLSDARARAAAIGLRDQGTAADPGVGGKPAVSGVPDPARGADAAACEDRLPAALSTPDALIATEQAIQLDELINWVAAMAAVSANQKEKSGE